MVRVLNFFCVALMGLTILGLYRVSESTRMAQKHLDQTAHLLGSRSRSPEYRVHRCDRGRETAAAREVVGRPRTGRGEPERGLLHLIGQQDVATEMQVWMTAPPVRNELDHLHLAGIGEPRHTECERGRQSAEDDVRPGCARRRSPRACPGPRR